MYGSQWREINKSLIRSELCHQCDVCPFKRSFCNTRKLQFVVRLWKYIRKITHPKATLSDVVSKTTCSLLWNWLLQLSTWPDLWWFSGDGHVGLGDIQYIARDQRFSSLSCFTQNWTVLHYVYDKLHRSWFTKLYFKSTNIIIQGKIQTKLKNCLLLSTTVHICSM